MFNPLIAILKVGLGGESARAHREMSSKIMYANPPGDESATIVFIGNPSSKIHEKLNFSLV